MKEFYYCGIGNDKASSSLVRQQCEYTQAGGPYIEQIKGCKLAEVCAIRVSILVIHADHVVQSAWILFSLWMYVCLYVSALERKRLIGMT